MATHEILEKKFKGLRGERDLINLILRDLRDTGLIYTEWENTNVHAMNRSASLPEITKMGRRFMDFISEG